MKTIHRIEAYVRAGEHLRSAIEKMINMAQDAQYLTSCPNKTYHVWQNLNGVDVVVDADSDPDLIFRDQQRAMKGYIPSPVGPTCKHDLTSAELASDLKICRQRERQAERRASALQKKRDKLIATCVSALSDAPTLQMIDDRFSKLKASLESKLEAALKSGDESMIRAARYNLRGAVFAEDWGRLMQKALLNGRTIKQCAASCSRIADYDGLSGALVQWAKRMLEEGWVRGAALKELR